MEVAVYNQEGKKVGSVDLKPEIFGIEPNEAVVHQYIVTYRTRQRQGNSSTKTRRQVRGGGRKPWRQKGTGRARAGTIRSPLWRGGGIVFGPSPKEYNARIPKTMKRLALRSIYSDKVRRESFKVVENLKLDEIKTRKILGIMTNLEISNRKVLVLDEGRNDQLALSCRNLPLVMYSRASLANGYDLLNADFVVVTRAGLDKVHEVLG